jgi:nicotinamidase-related amidase
MSELDYVKQFIAMKEQAPFTLDPRRTALLVIDMQRYFVRPDYPFAQAFEMALPGCMKGYFERVKTRVVPNTQKLLAEARRLKIPVFYTAVGSHTESGCDLPLWLRELDEFGKAVVNSRLYPHVSEGAYQIDDAVAPQSGDVVVHKASSGPLNSTRLDQTLHNMGLDTLIVCGLTSDVCVTQTARETADRGFRVVVAEDACTTISQEQHEAVLRAFHMAFGRVKSTDEILVVLGAGARLAAAS